MRAQWFVSKSRITLGGIPLMPPALALTPAERQARIHAQNAERQARFKERQAEKAERWRAALEQIAVAGTIREARAIAADALGASA